MVTGDHATHQRAVPCDGYKSQVRRALVPQSFQAGHAPHTCQRPAPTPFPALGVIAGSPRAQSIAGVSGGLRVWLREMRG